jgi:hypothetical protein
MLILCLNFDRKDFDRKDIDRKDIDDKFRKIFIIFITEIIHNIKEMMTSKTVKYI